MQLINLILVNLIIYTNASLIKRQNGCTPWREDFTNGLGNFWIDGDVNVNVNNGILSLKMRQSNAVNPDSGLTMGRSALATSNQLFSYGTFEARMKTARIGDVVTSFTLMSPQKDEIDWEWVGKNEYESQTNYFSKGIQDYTKGIFIPNNFNTHNEFHTYGIRWTPNEIVWLIDNNPVRTVTKQDAGTSFPDTAMAIKFSLWDGGSGLPGTRDWAGGPTNWNDPEYLANGFISTEVDYISYSC